MKSILNKISTTNSQQTIENILFTYEEQHYCVVNFVYFAQIVSQHVFGASRNRTEKEKEYKKCLLKGDFLLPDGIALQLFYYLAQVFGSIKSDNNNGEKLRLHNLNGTDFTPQFLKQIKQKYGNQKINIMLYGSTPKVAEKVKDSLTLKGYNVIYVQDGFSEFDWEAADKSLDEYQDTINVLLVARSTPKIPIQELRTFRNYQKIQESNMIVMNVGGLFDFIAGVQKRAPKFIRVIKLEWLWRLCTQPKRNYKKILNTLMAIPYTFHYLVLKKD